MCEVTVIGSDRQSPRGHVSTQKITHRESLSNSAVKSITYVKKLLPIFRSVGGGNRIVFSGTVDCTVCMHVCD
uniref:Uncharacterized protein n=1 Tax=Anguilla anguilla TaxID=7936 RepID=A0A0E9T7S6_ANGAN